MYLSGSYLAMCVCATGEFFDVTCFAGPSHYHSLRVKGEGGAASLASCMVRATDFELACQPADDSKDARAEFAKNTRGMFFKCLVYTAAIHLAWAKEDNHELISNRSVCVLQCTRADLQCLQTAQIDPQSQVVTLILDVVTDKRHFHIVRKAEAADAQEGGEGECGSYPVAIP